MSPLYSAILKPTLWQYLKLNRTKPVPVAARFKGTATLEPKPTQHSKPTFVWVYIAGTCGYI